MLMSIGAEGLTYLAFVALRIEIKTSRHCGANLASFRVPKKLAGETKTEEKEFFMATLTIRTKEDLVNLAQRVNSGEDFSGKTIELGANIVLNDTKNWASWNENVTGLDSWTPIGKSSSFKGTFDGKGYTISGIYINGNSTKLSDVHGLFGTIGSGGIVMNLGVLDSWISDNGNVGAIAGANNGTVANCYSNSIINGALGSTNKSCIGGLVGTHNGGGILANCYFIGKVKAKEGSSDDVGSLAGSSWSGSSITNSYSTFASVLIGYIGGNIENCYWNNTVYSGRKIADASDKSTGMAEAAMKAASFVATLNDNVDKLNSSQAKIIYRHWAQTANNFPILKPYPPNSAKEFELDQFAKGNLIAWNVTTNCAYTPTIELMDGDKKLFSITKKDGDHFQFLGNGSATIENTGKLKLKISIPQSSNIDSSIASGAVLNRNAKKVGCFYNICIEDFSDDDYSDVYVNIIGWGRG
jgi:hypothetical protein